MWASVPWKYVRFIWATEAIIQHAAAAVTPNPVVDATHGEPGATLRWPQRTRISHIPPNLVVRRCRRTLIASGSEDLQVEHPVRGRDATALHFHPTLACVQGPALVGDQVVQVCQPCQKRLSATTGIVKAFHREQFALHGVMRLIQQRAGCWHLRVCEDGIPARFLRLKPTPYTLTVARPRRGGDVVGKVA